MNGRGTLAGALAAALLGASTAPALAQTSAATGMVLRSRESSTNNAAVVLVPGAGDAVPGAGKPQAPAVVLLTPAGAPYTAGGGGSIGTLATPDIVGGSANAPLTQGTGSAGTNSLNVYVGGGSVSALQGGTANTAANPFFGQDVVSNGGTFAVQNTAATPAGGNTIGSVNALGSNGGALAQDSANRAVLVGPETAGAAAVGGGQRMMGKDSSGNAQDPTVYNGAWLVYGNGGNTIWPTVTSTAANTPVVSTAAAVVVKASAGNLYGFDLTESATAGYLAVLNASAVPAANAAIAPSLCIPVAANAAIHARQDIPDRYGTGVTLVSSTNCTTYVAVPPQVISAVVQ